MRKWILSLAFAATAFADDGSGLRGPVSGFVVDGRAIRAIEGLPGAARLGAPLNLAFPVAAAAIASTQDFALVVRSDSDGRPLLVRGLRAESPAAVEIEGAIAASSISIASSGQTALLYSPAARQLQFLTGLPASPRALDAVDLSGIADVAAVAIDSEGAWAILAAGDGQLYLAARGSLPRAVARQNNVTALATLPGKDAAIAAIAGTGDLILLEGLAGTPVIRTVGGAASGLGPARSVRALDGRTAAVIAADGRLAALDLETGSIEWIALAGAAENFVPLDRTLFVLNRAGDQPLLLLDSSRRSAWFVPADRRPVPRHSGAKGSGGEDRPH